MTEPKCSSSQRSSSRRRSSSRACARPGQHVQHDRFGDRQHVPIPVPVRDQRGQPLVDRTACGPVIFDPGGGVGQDHAVPRAAMSSGTASIACVPRMARASVRVIGWPARCRNASSTASVLESARIGAVARERIGTWMSDKADDDRAVDTAWEEDNAVARRVLTAQQTSPHPCGLLVCTPKRFPISAPAATNCLSCASQSSSLFRIMKRVA